jgi:hypothetical protein
MDSRVFIIVDSLLYSGIITEYSPLGIPKATGTERKVNPNNAGLIGIRDIGSCTLIYFTLIKYIICLTS